MKKIISCLVREGCIGSGETAVSVRRCQGHRGVWWTNSHEELADDDTEKRHADGGEYPGHECDLGALLGPVRVWASYTPIAARRLAQTQQLLLEHVAFTY